MNWKVACGNSNSSSAANTPTRNTTNAEPAAGSNVNVVSAKLMEHQSRDALEHERALKSSSDNSVTTGRNGDQNASMVETVAWVHVARGGAARQARSSIDNGDLLSKKEQPSTPSPEEKKMKKTGKMWGAKEKKKAKAEEAAAAAAALVNDKLAHERDASFSQRQARARTRCARARTLERSLVSRSVQIGTFTTFLGAERRRVFRHAKKSCREEDDDEQENLSARFGS